MAEYKAEYIEREAVAELFNKWADGYSYIEVPTKDAIACVRAIPAADVRPVVRGKWEDNTKDGGWKCSECGFISYSVGFYKRYKTKYWMRFCPNCGTDMRRKADD